MPGKTKKDLQTENSVLKEELLELRTKLSEKCECLQKQSKKEQLQKNKSFKCHMCDVAFERQKDLKNTRMTTNYISKCIIVKTCSMKNGS